MASLESHHAIEALLNCPVCFEPFTEPKVLRCNHTFCLPCLEQLAIGAMVVTCPTCREKTLKPAGGLSALTSDFKVSQIRDGLQAAARMAAPKCKCDVCRQGVGSVKCLQCRKIMCSGCVSKHNKRADASQHTLIQLQGVVKCADHEEDCTHVCADCSTLICLECTFHGCAEHDCVEIGQAARQYVTSGHLQDVQSGKLLSQLSQAKERQLEVFTSTEREVQRHADQVVNAIKAESKRLKEVLSTMRAQALEQLEMRRLAAEDHLLALAGLEIGSLQEGIPSALMAALPALHTSPPDAQSSDQDPSSILTVKFIPAVDLGDITIGDVVMEGAAEKAGVSRGKIFRFQKIVLVGQSSLLGLYDDLIVRNDFTTTTDKVRVYHKGVDDGFTGQEALVTKFKNIFSTDNWRDFLPNIKPMTKAIINYAEKNDIALKFKTPVHDRIPSLLDQRKWVPQPKPDHKGRPPSAGRGKKSITEAKFAGNPGNANKKPNPTGRKKTPHNQTAH